MQSDNSFEFEISISQIGYTSKPSSSDYATMKWSRETVSISQFIHYIITGHNYCHIYKHNRRCKDCFLYTNIVSIDVDKTETSLSGFLGTTDFKPTFAYETFSNVKDNIYSYRLAFIFKEKLNADTFVKIYEQLCILTGLSATKDHCGKVITQLMNGTSKNAYRYASSIIYSLETNFPECMGYNNVNKDISEVKSLSFPESNNSYIHNNNYNNTKLPIKRGYFYPLLAPYNPPARLSVTLVFMLYKPRSR